ncbi:expressed unknown protein [Seminavis robusta]|uniref:Uncharacterized protein n=1 Tax=Seminavis robusta TaxID=568900 RepID=A0A9N8DUF6_9STRA|nr:expressed unknown protein [Seminavis robusta]|eukprot:Sro365_g127300.1 n/a (1492) ;mRNA; r:2426-6901
MTVDAEPQVIPSAPTSPVAASNAPQDEAFEIVAAVDNKKAEEQPNQPREEEPLAADDRRSPVQDETRSPAPQARTASVAAESPSTYHTPEPFSPLTSAISSAFGRGPLDLAKVRSALTQLNSAVKEEEDHYFTQLEATESVNSKLRQNVVSSQDLRQKNDKLQEGLNAAQNLLDSMRSEAAVQVENLNESLVCKDIELAKLQAEYKVMSENKETELKSIRENMDKMELELNRLESAYQGSTQSLNSQEDELATLRAEYQSLQAGFHVLKAEKDDIEQGHEEAKEKWKRLVITMKSEYDNFRASFDHLKVTKKEMEETHRVEKNRFRNEVAVLKAENNSMSAAMDSLKICKEVTESEYKEAKTSWEDSKKALESQAARIRAELETAQAARKELDQKWRETETRFNEKVQELVADTEVRCTEAVEKLAAVEEDSANKIAALQEEKAVKIAALEEEKANRIAALEEESAKKLKETEEGLTNKLSAVEEELGNLKAEHSDLKIAKETIEFEKGTLQCDRDDLVKERDGLRTELENSTEELTALKEEHEKLTTNHDSKVSECDALKSEIERMEAAKEEIEKMFSQIQHDYDVQKDDYERLKPMEKQLEDCSAELEELKPRLAALEQDKADLESNLSETKDQLDMQTANAHVLQTELDGAKSQHKDEKKTLEKKILKLGKTVETKAEALNLGLTKYMKEAKAKEKLERDMEIMKKELTESMDQEREAAVAKMKELTESKDQEREAAIAKMNEKMEENRAYEAEQREAALAAQVAAENKLAEYEKTVAKTEAEILSAKCQGDSVRAALDVSETGRQEAETKVEELSKSLDELTAKWETVSAEAHKLRADVALGQQRKIVDKQDMDHMNQQIAALNQSVAKKISTIAQLEAKTEKMETDILTKTEKQKQLETMVDSKDKELELFKSRCESLQTSLHETEEELEKKIDLTTQLQEFKGKSDETSILMEKKNKELQAVQERCEKLQASLKKAETLYLDGVEQIKNEAERKQKAALEDALDRIYVLNERLAKKEHEMVFLHEKLNFAGQDDEEGRAEVQRRAEAQVALAKKLKFLDNMVASKDSEIQLLEARCADMKSSLEKAEKHPGASEEQSSAEEKLKALNEQIEQQEAKLKSLQTRERQAKLKSTDDEFEVVLNNADSNLASEVDMLRARCKELEEREKEEEGTDVAGWKARVADMETSMEKLKQQYLEECARRKEAEQVFSSISKANNETTAAKPPTASRGIFNRSKPAPEQGADGKKASSSGRWLSLRGRRKKDEMTVRTESTPRIQTAEKAEDWRSQYSGSPRRRQENPVSTRAARSLVGSGDLVSQIPSHIQNNFLEVGVYKQRLTNTYLPVLCLGPNDVPAGPVRDEWLNKIGGKSKVQNLGVYFYGKEGKDDGAYGLVPWFAFVPYNKAVQRGLDKLPEAIADKIQYKQELTDEEKQIHKGIEAMKEAAAKSKEERRHPMHHLTAVTAKEVPKTIVTDSSGSDDDNVSEMGV